MKHILVTGVSSGIGCGIVENLAKHGFNVFGSVRREEDGVRVKEMLGENFTPLLFDVTDRSAVLSAADQVKEQLGENGLMGLINNAGVAVAGPLTDISVEKVRHQLEINILGMLNVIQIFLPLLGMQQDPIFPPGRIINISSISGSIALPFMGPYAISKHAVEALSDSLRRELMAFGIDVIVIKPGPVKTPIFEKSSDLSEYHNSACWPMLMRFVSHVKKNADKALPVSKVSDVVYTALTADRPKTRYVVTADWFKRWFLQRYLPDRWFDTLLDRQIGLKTPKGN
jgi:NAD(P)-dependent dehydrogenase (short-subunit alcohol dehydrogenase family)